LAEPSQRSRPAVRQASTKIALKTVPDNSQSDTPRPPRHFLSLITSFMIDEGSSCHAFAIIVLQTPHPSMALRPVDVLPSQRRAGARVRRQTLCYAVLRRGIATILVKKDRAEVSSLSREVMSAFHLNPYPPRYRPAFASSAFPYPHPRQPSSRSACPTRARIRAYHVPPE